MDKEFIELIRFESLETSHLTETSALRVQIEATKNTLLSSSLKVSKNTVPLIQTYVDECSDILKIDPSSIECYIYATPDHNAFSISQRGNNILVAISSSLIKILKQAELKFLIGHELGHALFDHSELTHLGHAEMDYQLTRSLREMEISADRIGYLCANSLENSVTAMMKIASGLDNEFLNQDIRPFLDQSVSLANQLDNGKYNNTTHPPLPLRARSLVWLSTISPFNNGKSTGAIRPIDQIAISKINDQIRSEISAYFDKAIELEFREESDFFRLLFYTSYLARNGSLTKRDQQLIVKECGEDSNKLFLLMADLSKSQAETMLTSKLKDSFRKMLLYSVSDSHTFVKEYADKFGIPDEYINHLT